MGFSRQDYWNGLPWPLSGDLPDLGIEPVSPELAGRFFTTSTTWEAPCCPSLWYNLPLFPFAVMQFLAPGQKLTFLNKALNSFPSETIWGHFIPVAAFKVTLGISQTQLLTSRTGVEEG